MAAENGTTPFQTHATLLRLQCCHCCCTVRPSAHTGTQQLHEPLEFFRAGLCRWGVLLFSELPLKLASGQMLMKRSGTCVPYKPLLHLSVPVCLMPVKDRRRGANSCDRMPVANPP